MTILQPWGDWVVRQTEMPKERGQRADAGLSGEGLRLRLGALKGREWNVHREKAGFCRGNALAP